MRWTTLRWAAWAIIVIPMALFLSFAGCSDEESPLEPTPVDVNSYLRGLPSWSEVSPELGDDDYVGDAANSIDWDAQMVCKTTHCSITRTPDKIVTYSPGSEILYLGSLIQGRSYIGGLGSIEELPIRQRGPIKIVIDLHIPNSTRTVTNPSLTTVMDAIHDLVAEAEANQHVAGSSIDFTQTSSHSVEQSSLALGFSAKYMGVSVRSSLKAERSSTTNTVAAFFIQKMYTTSIELPQTPASFFSDAFTKTELDAQVKLGRIGPDNLPVYVSNIVWGRMMAMTMTSTESTSNIEAALRASYAGMDGSVSATHLATIANSKIKLVTVGGDQNAALGFLETGELGKFFEEGAPLTTAVPLSYTLRNLGDNSIAKVSETSAYDLVECSPFEVILFNNEADWRDAALSAGMLVDEFNTTAANMGLATELPGAPSANAWLPATLTFEGVNTSFAFDFYVQNRSVTPDIYGLTWNDDEMDPRGDWLSIGDADNYENDDFDIGVTDTLVHAIGVTIGHNGWGDEEYLEIWGADGLTGTQYLRQFSREDMVGTATGGNYFIGVISPVPLRLYSFNEDAGGDDIYIGGIRFATR